MGTFKINGRTRFYRRITSVQKVKHAFVVATYHGEYTIDGGKKGGGTRRDWFVEGTNIHPAIACTSVLDALNLLDTM